MSDPLDELLSQQQSQYSPLLKSTFWSRNKKIIIPIGMILILLWILSMAYFFYWIPRIYTLTSSFDQFVNTGNGMAPTIVDRQTYSLDKNQLINRGDIVLFVAPPVANCPAGTGCEFLKRVIAIPGDSISIRQGVVYLNGVILPEPYVDPDILTVTGSWLEEREVQVQAGEYFVMGDNRPHSSDSRAYGPVRKDDIKGVVLLK